MEYWVAMNSEELEVALILLEKTSLPGIIEIKRDYNPKPSTLSAMVEKGFFLNGENGTKWNPFVRTVLTCAFNADSELNIEENDHVFCRLFFYNEYMIMLTRDVEEDLFVFYYVPLLPKAIGCLASCLDKFQDGSTADHTGETISFTYSSEIDNASSLVSIVSESNCFENADQVMPRLTIEGRLMGKLDLIKALVSTPDGFWLIDRCENEIHVIPTTYYDFIQNLSRWIVSTHGQSIRKAGVYSG